MAKLKYKLKYDNSKSDKPFKHDTWFDSGKQPNINLVNWLIKSKVCKRHNWYTIPPISNAIT